MFLFYSFVLLYMPLVSSILTYFIIFIYFILFNIFILFRIFILFHKYFICYCYSFNYFLFYFFKFIIIFFFGNTNVLRCVYAKPVMHTKLKNWN